MWFPYGSALEKSWRGADARVPFVRYSTTFVEPLPPTGDELRPPPDAGFVERLQAAYRRARHVPPGLHLERFRAVVRSLEERAVIDPRPGRTAWEAAQTAGERVPEVADGLERGAHLFDDVAYGKAVVGPEADAFLRALDERTLAARPALRPEVASAAAPGGDGA